MKPKDLWQLNEVYSYALILTGGKGTFCRELNARFSRFFNHNVNLLVNAENILELQGVGSLQLVQKGSSDILIPENIALFSSIVRLKFLLDVLNLRSG